MSAKIERRMTGFEACRFPGLFLVNDFTVPGDAAKQGRRQEPCITQSDEQAPLSEAKAQQDHSSAALLAKPSRPCQPSSFGSRYETVNSKIRF